jgi:hypothetical protein
VIESRDEPQTLTSPEAPEMMRHTLTIELRADQRDQLLTEDRREHSIERLWQAGRGLGGLLIILMAVVGYIRLDDWTRGYLSLPLKLGARAVAVAGPVVVWWLI